MYNAKAAEGDLFAEPDFSLLRYFDNVVWSNRLFGRSGRPPLRYKLRFLLKCLLHPRASNLWFSYLRRAFIPRHSDAFREILQYPHKPFFDQNRTPIEKARLLRSSYELSRAFFGDSLFHRVMAGERIELAKFRTKHGEALRIVLSQEARFLREGTLSLSLVKEDEVILSVAYTCSLLDAERVALVGCMQAGAQDALAKIRHLTHECFGMQPRLLLIRVLKTVCSQANIHRIEAVSSANHIYMTARYRRKKRVLMDYDSLWEMAGGLRQANGNYSLPLDHRAKPIDAYPSHKRAEQRKRQALLEDVDRQVRTLLTA